MGQEGDEIGSGKEVRVGKVERDDFSGIKVAEEAGEDDLVWEGVANPEVCKMRKSIFWRRVACVEFEDGG